MDPSTTVHYVRSGPGGTDTLFSSDQSRSYVVTQAPSGLFVGPEPFADGDLVQVAPDGSGFAHVVRRADAPVATVTRIDARGDTAYTVEVRVDRRPVTEADVGEALEGYNERNRATFREVMFVPEFHAPVHRTVTGRDGSVWLGTSTRTNGAEGPAALWCRVGADGVVDRSVLVPASVEIMAADGDRLWGVEPSDFDIPVVVQLTLARAP
jgi:hypothetical protein